jgi:hypothetical protein
LNDQVIQSGKLYVAKGAVPAGTFQSTQWDVATGVTDTTALVQKAGDTMTGKLTVPEVDVTITNPAKVGLIVKGAAGQTADAINVLDNAGTPKIQLGINGYTVGTGFTANSGFISINNGGEFHLDCGASNISQLGTKAGGHPAHYLCGMAGKTTDPVLQVYGLGGWGPADILRCGTGGTARMAGVTSNGLVFGTGPFTNLASFRKHKDDIEHLSDDAVNTVKAFMPRKYKHKLFNATEYGFVIEEIKQVVPECVVQNAAGEDEGYQITQLIPILTKAIQELTARLEALEAK